MVLSLDGNSFNGAHVRSNLCYLICLRLLISSRAGTNQIFLSERPIFLHTELPSNISTIGMHHEPRRPEGSRLVFIRACYVLIEEFPRVKTIFKRILLLTKTEVLVYFL